jgi:hypothetical protein
MGRLEFSLELTLGSNINGLDEELQRQVPSAELQTISFRWMDTPSTGTAGLDSSASLAGVSAEFHLLSAPAYWIAPYRRLLQ